MGGGPLAGASSYCVRGTDDERPCRTIRARPVASAAEFLPAGREASGGSVSRAVPPQPGTALPPQPLAPTVAAGGNADERRAGQRDQPPQQPEYPVPSGPA